MDTNLRKEIVTKYKEELPSGGGGRSLTVEGDGFSSIVDYNNNNNLRTAELEGTFWIIESSSGQGGPVGESNSQPRALQPDS